MFGMKSKASLEDILDALSKMSEEEKDKIRESLGKKESTEEMIEEAKENIAEKGADSQTEKDRVDESVGEQEKLDDDEDSQTAKDRVDEAEGEEKQEEQEDLRAMVVALEARIAALEKAKEQAADEEIGASDDLADTEGVFHRMPESYVEQAKKMRY